MGRDRIPLAQTVSTHLFGKLGDQYGRKQLFQIAIVIFLIGSALCGAAQSMGQLIAFRAVQGLGGGGLMVTALTIVGDVVAPRDRGRYQGVFGAVFGVSSVAGPLLGGFFVDHATWRWVFYINWVRLFWSDVRRRSLQSSGAADVGQ